MEETKKNKIWIIFLLLAIVNIGIWGLSIKFSGSKAGTQIPITSTPPKFSQIPKEDMVAGTIAEVSEASFLINAFSSGGADPVKINVIVPETAKIVSQGDQKTPEAFTAEMEEFTKSQSEEGAKSVIVPSLYKEKEESFSFLKKGQTVMISGKNDGANSFVATTIHVSGALSLVN